MKEADGNDSSKLCMNLTRKYCNEANLTLKSNYLLVDETELYEPKADETAVDKIYTSRRNRP